MNGNLGHLFWYFLVNISNPSYLLYNCYKTFYITFCINKDSFFFNFIGNWTDLGLEFGTFHFLDSVAIYFSFLRAGGGGVGVGRGRATINDNFVSTYKLIFLLINLILDAIEYRYHETIVSKANNGCFYELFFKRFRQY